jgi:thioester reductase-like protein
VIIGGERVLPEKVAIWQKYVGIHPQLINTYGPTETTIVATFCNLSSTETYEQEVSIGHSISNVQVYILDQYLQPLPMGVLGEIHIGGAGLARGYLNRPDLTNEKFIPNPFLTGTRLYKTGDLAYYRLDGAIEFIGRIDTQVKVRGFRIELGEIEAVLAKYQDVQHTVAIAKQDSLIAYVVAHSRIPTPNQLRDFLKQQLPYYMVPNTFVFLTSLPLTPNGKIDRKALPDPETTKTEQGNSFKSPRTPLEKELVDIWSEILKIQQISINDNFFNLGGHSLLIVQMFARIRSAYQVDLPLQDLFEAPTVETLAAKLEIIQQTRSSTAISTNPTNPTNPTNSTLDLKAEAVLDPTITAEGRLIENITEPACIFLTGATGFLGAFLLDELLQQTQADIYCLVRAANAEEGKQKIQRSLESHLIWNQSYSSRIIPVVGDLSQPLLGLSDAQFIVLAQKLDVIYHNGALVHHASPYSTLKATNVIGTEEVLRLASQIKIKPVHFVSTISVFSAPTGTGVKLVYEQSNLDDYPIPEGGYTQSKWVAEKLVTIARDRGLPVSIYRPGRVSGHSNTGAFNPNDFFCKLLIGCVQLGTVPQKEFFDSLTPVDYVSKAIIYLSRQQESLGKAFHVLNQELLNLKMLFNVVRSFGYPLQQVSDEQWQLELMKIAKNFPNHPLYPLIPLFNLKEDHLSHSKPQISNFVALEFDCNNTQQGLIGTSIAYPPTDKDLVATYFSYLIRNKFVSTPKVAEITII